MLLIMEKGRVVLYAGTWPRSLGYPKPHDSWHDIMTVQPAFYKSMTRIDNAILISDQAFLFMPPFALQFVLYGLWHKSMARNNTPHAPQLQVALILEVLSYLHRSTSRSAQIFSILGSSRLLGERSAVISAIRKKKRWKGSGILPGSIESVFSLSRGISLDSRGFLWSSYFAFE